MARAREGDEPTTARRLNGGRVIVARDGLRRGLGAARASHEGAVLGSSARHDACIVDLMRSAAATETRSRTPPRAGVVLAAILALTLGCAASGDPSPTSASAALEMSAPSEPGDALGTSLATPSRASEDVVLDTRADGARLTARVLPLRPDGDPERVLRLSPSGLTPRLTQALEAARVLDARFVTSGVLVLSADHTLAVHREGGSSTLDEGVYPPLSVVGDDVAYARGPFAALEVARANATTGRVAALTRGMAPAWSPALDEEARAVVFVSASSGAPRLYRVREGATPSPLPPLGRFPDSVRAPRFEGGLFVFEDTQGTVFADLERGRVVRTLGGQR